MTKHFLRCMAGCAALFATASVLPAATIEVPGDHASIQAAIDDAATTHGDTILITNGGVYAENLMIDKALTIAAEAGLSPTITNPGALGDTGIGGTGNGEALITFAEGSSGAQLGTLDGGRIRINMNTLHPALQGVGESPTTRLNVIIMDDAAEEVTFENLYYTRDMNNPPGENYRVHFIRDNAGAGVNRNVTLNNVELDVNEQNGNDGLIRLSSNPDAVYNLNQVYIHNLGDGGSFALYARFGATYRIDSSYIDATDQPDDSGAIRILTNGPTDRGGNVRMDNSVVRSDLSPAIWRTTGASSVTLTNSVLVNLGGNSLYASGDNGGVWDIVDADHCDFVVLNASSSAEAIFEAEQATTKTISITNSNIVGFGTSSADAVDINVGVDDNVTLLNNNVFAPNWDGLYSDSAAPLATNSLSLDPDYSGDVASGDVRYDNATLKTADTTGGAIGNDADLSGIIPQPPPPVNPARDWWLY